MVITFVCIGNSLIPSARLPTTTTFVIGTERVFYVSVFSPRQLSSSLNSFASSFITKL